MLECKPESNVSIDEIEELEIDIEPLIKPKPKIISSINTSLNKKVTNTNDDVFKPFSGKGRTLGTK